MCTVSVLTAVDVNEHVATCRRNREGELCIPCRNMEIEKM